MKRLLTYAGMAAIVFTACQKKDEFKLVSSEMPETLNGKYVYIQDENHKAIDSVKVENGAFTYAATTDTLHARYAIVDGQPLVFIQEPALITVTKKEGSNVFSVEGGRLNTLCQELQNEAQKVYAPLDDQLRKIATDSLKSDEEKNQMRDQLVKETTAKLKDVITNYYSTNRDNAIGAMAFESTPFGSEEEFIVAYEAAPEHIQGMESLKKRYEMFKTASKTQVGADYVDFEIKDANGNVTKLSDYVGNGKYLLIDFWASWCGPCRKAMPHLADLNKKYSHKGLRVLSIGTWDKPEDNATAIKELGMTWETLLDTENAGTKTYGISGIPTLMLLSPEGKILVRTHVPDEVTAKLEEVIK